MDDGDGGFRLGKKNSGKSAAGAGEVDYKSKAGTASSHNFLNQKPWHPLSYPNQRRKWIAEQTHANCERQSEEVVREASFDNCHIMVHDDTGGDASLATSWEVFHTNEKMPEEQMERHKKHLERFHVGEQAFRESHPDYPDYPPERTILPVTVKTTILEHAFSNAAAKGRLPLYGGSSKLNRPDISMSRTPAAHGYYFSPEAQEIRDLHAELASMKKDFEERMQAKRAERDERERAMREELLTQLRSEMSQYASPYAQPSTQTSYYQPAPAPTSEVPPQNLQDYEQFQRFLDWQRMMNNGSGGSN